MIILTKFLKNILEYEKLGKANIFPVQYGCKNCGYLGKLHRHGFYYRNAITRYTIHRVVIIRFKCPSCKKTYSLLPSFLIPYYQYTFDTIFLCLYYMFILQKSYLEIIAIFNSFNPYTFFSISNIFSFKKRFFTTLSFINSFFTHYEDFYYDLDKPSLRSVTKKIEKFISKQGEFNYSFFEVMPKYFFAKT